MEKIDYLIIGNGITGLSAAQEIRKQDGKGRILIISQEEIPTYYRVKLSPRLFPALLPTQGLNGGLICI